MKRIVMLATFALIIGMGETASCPRRVISNSRATRGIGPIIAARYLNRRTPAYRTNTHSLTVQADLKRHRL